MVANLVWWSASLITWITSVRLHPGYPNLTPSQVKIFFGPDDHLRSGSGAPEGLDGRLAIRNNINYDFFPKPSERRNQETEHLTGTRFSSDSDVKTAAENNPNGQGRGFYQVGLNKLVLRSDKCLNRLVYLEKWSASMPLNSILYFLSNINK
ncbi:hypothetical protein AVEN_117484-1 [Araneus ventricosus]|uniref:Uncharacterized protein n=1 Tax=Araneus ventricosus TaxID=182803 RepID=A0A4Y2REQ3_ARAVE|nr:hypothetical protein AVEN_117484-1 [Araneus ventricosus]